MREQCRVSRTAAATLCVMATITLGGCSGPSTTTSPTLQNPQAIELAQQAMARGPMLVVVEGTPYAMPNQDFAARVLDDAQLAMAWTASPRLTSDPAAATSPSRRVVMTFNGDVPDASAQCHGNTQGGGPGKDGRGSHHGQLLQQQRHRRQHHRRASTARPGIDDHRKSASRFLR